MSLSAPRSRDRAREWWRPTAPVVLAAHTDRVFVRADGAPPWRSPFMSFAPRLAPGAAEALPAVHHFDGTARPQTVTPPADDEGGGDEFMHALLAAIARVSEHGLGVLINTSFNTKGKPIVNIAAEALAMLCTLPDLTHVVVADAAGVFWLFQEGPGCASVGV